MPKCTGHAVALSVEKNARALTTIPWAVPTMGLDGGLHAVQQAAAYRSNSVRFSTSSWQKSTTRTEEVRSTSLSIAISPKYDPLSNVATTTSPLRTCGERTLRWALPPAHPSPTTDWSIRLIGSDRGPRTMAVGMLKRRR